MNRQLMRKILGPLVSYFGYRRRYDAIPEFMCKYREENQHLMLVRTRVLTVIGILLYMNLATVDQLLYRDKAALFLTVRLLFSFGALMGLAAGFTTWGAKQIQYIFLAVVLFGDFGSSFMAAKISGWSSLYFVGNILLTASVTMFIPWSPFISLGYCALTLVGYVAINSIYHPFSPEMLIPTMLLFTNGALAFFSSMGGEINRMSQLSARLEIQTAHEELKKLDEAKARFFSNISHELRTPLTLIIGPLDVMARHGQTPTRDFLEAMITNARRLLRHVNALLDLSKVDSKQMTCQYETGNLSQLLIELSNAAVPGASERGLEIVTKNIEVIPNSYFDLEKIETIAANLISNAVKFSPRGGTIALSCKLSDQEKLVFSVQDSGAGVPEESRTKVFERFHQLDNSSTRAVKGTGLGLAVAKEFAELHGGKIWVNNAPQGGACFHVEIPLKISEDSLAENKRSSTQQTHLVDLKANEGLESEDKSLSEENLLIMSERQEKKPIVLYVDDNRDLRNFVKSLLIQDYTVLLAQDGLQGYEQAKIHSPDLILSDVMMPRMNGIDLCKKIRSELSFQLVPFILLTAKSSLDSKLEGLEDGADDYLSKPFSEAELRSRIQNLIKMRKQQIQIKRQLKASREIQRSLLPPFEQEIGPITVEALYEPCEELSGDFFDVIASGQWIYIYLADVTSHGVAAAQVTYLVKQIFTQTLGTYPEISIQELFKRVRSSYLEHKLEYDLGLQILRINIDTLTMDYMRSNAPSPYKIAAMTKAIEYFTSPISPLISTLTIDDVVEASVIQSKLIFGESLYLFTDGAYEFCIPSGIEFGSRRLSKALHETHNSPWPESLIATLRSANKDAHFQDDLTILRVHVREPNRIGLLTAN